MIEPKPQSYDTLRQRYPEALRQVYDIDAGILDPRPGEQAQHIFDHTDGVRLIISRDKSDGKTILHVSASWWMNNFGETATLDRVFGFIFEAISEITGHPDPKSYLVLVTGGKGIPHFLFPDPGPP